MTKNEIKKVYNNIHNVRYLNEDETFGDWWEIFNGCGLSNFNYPKYVTLNNASKFLKYQCLQLNGDIDSNALDECCYLLKEKFILVD